MSNVSKIILKATNVEKSFGEVHVLQSVDLTVYAGESISIRGESGAGKSTLLSILTLLERVDQGQIYWGELDATNRSNAFLAPHRGSLFGLVFQSYYLIPELDALENVLMARRLLGRLKAQDHQHAKALLERVGLKDRFYHKTTQLSGGESQRVAVARALINKPPLIIADEPTGNLDENTSEEVMDLLLELCQEESHSLVLVTHNPNFIARTEKQALLSQGKLHFNV